MRRIPAHDRLVIRPTDPRPRRPPLLGAALIALATLLGLAWSAGAALRAAPAAQEQGEATIHLPFMFKNADGSQTYKPPAKSPTPSPEPTATLEPSPTVMATFTPLPTFTPAAGR